MHYPIIPIVANQFMEEFEIKAINTATNPQRYGPGMLMTHRHIEVLVIQKTGHSHQLLQQIISLTLTSSLLVRSPTEMVSYPSWTP